MSFEQLMAELQEQHAAQETLSKALPAGDGKDEEKIQAAAAEGGLEGGGAGDGTVDDKGEKPEGEGDGKAPMAKSFQLTLADGSTVEAQDGAEMIKALTDRIEQHETGTAAVLTSAMDLIKGQAAMIKSLGEQVTKLGGQGSGRKAVISLVQKPEPTMAKSHQPDGMTPDVFFAKAMKAQAEGRLSGHEIATAEACLNRGEQIPANIVAKAMA